MAEEYVYKKVDSLVFGMLSPQMIKKMASAKIITPDLYDKEGYPVDGGLMDVRLGVIDPGLRCKTCGGRLKGCSGHFGYIDLAGPVVHLKYINVIQDFLKSSCRDCGKILVTEDKKKAHLKLLDEVTKEGSMNARKSVIDEFINSLKNVKKCLHCKAKQGSIKVEKPTTFVEDGKKLSPREIKTRLERISDEDIELLGLNPQYAKPAWAILTFLPVPPVVMRPSITLETGE